MIFRRQSRRSRAGSSAAELSKDWVDWKLSVIHLQLINVAGNLSDAMRKLLRVR